VDLASPDSAQDGSSVASIAGLIVYTGSADHMETE
jgi:hypothetical protein